MSEDIISGYETQQLTPAQQTTAYDVFLKGEFIDLIALNEDVVKGTNWYKWFNDAESTQHMQKHYFPNTMTSQLEFLNDLRKNQNKIQLGIVKKDAGRMIGTISLQSINFFNRNADISILIGEEEGRKLVYAQEAMQLMIEHGFFTLNLHKIYGGYVQSLESWGVFLNKRFGFKAEGLWREHVFKNGKYVDVYRIGLLRSEYLATIKGEEEHER